MKIILFNDYETDYLHSLNYYIQECECEACKNGKIFKNPQCGYYWCCDDGKNCYDKNTKKSLNFKFAGIKEMKIVPEL